MRKVIYILILAVAASMTITSCTEQEVKPAEGGGAAATDPKG
jgi:hypothetical protein